MYIIEWRVIGGPWMEWKRYKIEDSRDHWLARLQAYKSAIFEFRKKG